VSDLIRAEAERSAAQGTQIEVITAPFGVAYIETRFEALIGAYAAAEVAAKHHERFDAVIVAAFGDPGLAGLREALSCPVTGLTEAALASASLLGQRFSIVAISQRIRAWYLETVQHIGLESRLASIRGLDEPLADIGNVQGNQGERLVALAERCVDEDGADVIVLAGAPLAGLARSLRGRLPVPVVDGVSSAVRHVESLVSLQPGKAVRGSFAPPPVKPNQGLSPALERLLARGRHV
jgi:Asp/Glu/hydantoin racemase